MKRTRSNAFILENEKAWEPAGEGVVRQDFGVRRSGNARQG